MYIIAGIHICSHLVIHYKIVGITKTIWKLGHWTVFVLPILSSISKFPFSLHSIQISQDCTWIFCVSWQLQLWSWCTAVCVLRDSRSRGNNKKNETFYLHAVLLPFFPVEQASKILKIEEQKSGENILKIYNKCSLAK